MGNEQWICAKCGTLSSGKFCTRCGTPQPQRVSLQKKWLCSKCGKENIGKFCVYCGHEAGKPATFKKEQRLADTQLFPATGTMESLGEATNPNEFHEGQYPAGNKKNYFWMLLIVLLLGAGAGYFYTMQTAQVPDTASQQQNQEKKEENQEVKAEPFLRSDSGAGIGKVFIGESLDQVREDMGQENKMEARNNGLTAYVYDDINVIVTNNIVTGLESNSDKVATQKGIHQNSSLDEVLAAYGQDAIISPYEELELYEYDTPTDNGMNMRLRFAMNKDKKVEYISIRKVEGESGAQVEYEVDLGRVEATARNVLSEFHRYITQHQLRNAYNCLSVNMQNRMTYDGWASGFRNTVSSNVSNVRAVSVKENRVVLAYNLTAVDNPGGRSYYHGTATVIHTAEGWKIDYIENHR